MMVAICVLAAIGVAVAAWEGGKKLVGWGEGEVHHLTGWVKTETYEAKKWVGERMDTTIQQVHGFVNSSDAKREALEARVSAIEKAISTGTKAVEQAATGCSVIPHI